MTPHDLFPIPNTAAALCWLMLMVSPPGSALPRRIALGAAVLLAMTYAALIGAFVSQGQGDFQSLAGVQRLFQHPGLLLAGWVHYLVFDLLVGLWERAEAHRIGLSRWLLLPCLFLTFMFGPIGWLVFLAVRQFRLRSEPNPAAIAL